MTSPQVQSNGTSLIVTMANRYGLDPHKFSGILEKTILPAGKQASQEQVAAFLVVANHYSLNPFIKEIYAFPAQSGGITPIVSVDGWLTIINRQPSLDGIEYIDHLDDTGKLTAITCKIYRKDRGRPNEITEYMNECRRSTTTWNQWPSRMLRHKALIQCARQAFGLAGIYDPDEAERIADSEATGAHPVVEKTRARADALKEKLMPSGGIVPEFVDAEIVEQDIPLVEEVTSSAPFEEAEPAPVVDKAVSKKADWINTINDKLVEVFAGNAEAIATYLEGRELTTQTVGQLKDIALDLDKHK